MSKSEFQRDLIDYPIAIKKAGNRNAKLRLLAEFEAKHGELPHLILDAYGHSEYVRGFRAGVLDATEDYA